MTVSSTTNRIQYNGDGATVDFAYAFKVFDEDDLTVVLTDGAGTETTQTITTHYSVSGVGVEAGGNVTMVTAPALGETLTIKRKLAIKQETDYITGSAFPASSHEDALDKLTMICQQLDEELDRSLKLALSSGFTDLEIPDPSALQYLRWNSGATALENAALTALGDLTAHAADGQAHRNAASAVTIASGVVDVSGDASADYLEVHAESGTSDYLTQITGLADGDRVLLKAASGDSITLEGGASLRMPMNFTLNSVYDRIELQCVGSDVCVEISRSNNV